MYEALDIKNDEWEIFLMHERLVVQKAHDLIHIELVRQCKVRRCDTMPG